MKDFIHIRFRLFKYRYRISFRIGHDWCGADAVTLKPRPGETWNRGNDLDDGKMKDWHKVLWSIVEYEFGIGRWAREITNQQVRNEVSNYLITAARRNKP